MISHRSLVLLAALSCAASVSTHLLAVEPSAPTPTLTEQVTQAVTKEVMTQLKAEVPGLIEKAQASSAAAPVVQSPVAIETPVPPVAAPPQGPSAGTRVANVGADALELMLAKAKQYGGRIEDGLSKAVDYTMQEAPIVVAEWLKWRLVQHGVPAVFGVLLHITCLVLYVWMWRTANKQDWDSDSKGFSRVFGGMIGAGANIAILCSFTAPHVMTSLQILVAPRVYILESLSKMVGH